MSLASAIAEAEGLLPGEPSVDGQPDPRWQAIIEISEFIPSHPVEVWHFAQKWGSHPQPDLQAAIATCLVEHLLEQRFEEIAPLAVAAVQSNAVLATTVRQCWLSPELAQSASGQALGLGDERAKQALRGGVA